MKSDGSVIRLGLAEARTRSRENRHLVDLRQRIERLFNDLRTPVFRYVVSLGATAVDADEMIQETFLRAFECLRRGDTLESPRGWVFRVAHNIAINELKGRRRHELLDPDGWSRLIAASPDASLGPEALLLEKERMAQLYAAVDALSSAERHCINLRAEGCRYREIAEILEMPISTVADTLRRAIEKLTKETDG